MEQQLTSILLQNAVQELTRLPGIGKKTALRLALHLLRQPAEIATALGESVIKLRNDIQYCKTCHTISDGDKCMVCSDSRRDHSTICVVEDIRDMMAIENTSQFHGAYHILGGVISPMEGIGPSDLMIASLIEKSRSGSLKEVILALPSTVEGDTTNFYIFKTLKDTGIAITTIARGIPVGDELDYTDEITLGRSILNRQVYQGMGR
ncbi:MAG: recombination protein RecR [Bacteroidales bacterium]|nr:recombination protein RecR [Bacteroidales bacterium]